MIAAPVLEARGIAKAFGGVRAVDGVDLVLPRGEIRALIGPNGAGKTTFFNMLTGQLAPDAGEVRFKGERLTGLPPHRVWRRGVSRTLRGVVSLQSIRRKFRTALLCAVLQMGVLSGVQMPPEKIRALLDAMNQPAVVHVLRDDDDRGGPPGDDDEPSG